ncbi:MAG: hypothetical protein NZ651_06265 [Candidatus Bipolaricaulota bacterium]|nr:hypothetical protein [Candidatus Bipolaricaulota bacterium]MDW8127358.1 hypothetical protein [Candidatus Bipolaricaulota bacterium]
MIVDLQDFQRSRYWREGLNPQEVEAALRYAEERFYTLTNRHRYGYWFEPKELEIFLDGTGSQLLRSPYPIVEVIEVKVITAFGTFDITARVRARGHFLYRLDGAFPEGVANIQLLAAFGDPAYVQQEIPEDAREAVRRLAYNKLRFYRIAGEELDERRPPTESPPPPTLTGDREVDGIIRSYTIESPLFYLDIRGPIETPESEDAQNDSA